MSSHVGGRVLLDDSRAILRYISDVDILEDAMEAEIRFNNTTVEEFSIILGVKKNHVRRNLNGCLASIRRNRASDIVEDIWKGRYGLSEFALKHFKEADARERPRKNEIFLRFKLFADIMVICFMEDFNGNGPCFRSFQYLHKKDKNAIGANIGITLRIMEIEGLATDEIKQLVYNNWSKCNKYADSTNVIEREAPIKVMIDTAEIPCNQNFPAHLQIGTLKNSKPINIFLWFNKKLFIQKNHSVFTISATHIEQVKNKVVTVSLQERGHGRWCCLYGNALEHTAEKEASFPDRGTTKLLASLKIKNGEH